jgi:hypothetical protein
MRVAAHVPDLMDRSRLRSTKAEVVLVADPAELVGLDVDLVVVDLSRPGVLDVLGDIGVRTVGFAAHVEEKLMAAASTAGCDEVLARSVFFRRFPDLAN